MLRPSVSHAAAALCLALATLGGACGERAAAPAALRQTADGHLQVDGPGVRVLLAATETQLVADASHAVHLRLQDGADQPLATAELVKADLWMPAHGHGARGSARVSRDGEAAAAGWRVEGLVPSMSGAWQLRLDVRLDAGVTRILVPLTVTAPGA